MPHSELYSKILAEAAADAAGARTRALVNSVAVASNASAPDPVTLRAWPLHRIASLISLDWGQRIYFGAVPYLEALADLDSVEDNYGADRGDMIVRYFLSNASSWRGPVARAVKAELKRRLK